MDRAAAGYAIKAEVRDLARAIYRFAAQKTMYGGRAIGVGDRLFLFASENEGGCGLFARGVVSDAAPEPPLPGIARQTPRVSITVGGVSRTTETLGRAELRGWRGRDDGSPQAELDFKLYRQATDKIVGLSVCAVAFLDGFF